MFKMATAESCSSPSLFLRYVLMRRSAENDLSAEHEVAGMEARIFAAALYDGRISPILLSCIHLMSL